MSMFYDLHRVTHTSCVCASSITMFPGVKMADMESAGGGVSVAPGSDPIPDIRSASYADRDVPRHPVNLMTTSRPRGEFPPTGVLLRPDQSMTFRPFLSPGLGMRPTAVARAGIRSLALISP
jgi:hypothetical protein